MIVVMAEYSLNVLIFSSSLFISLVHENKNKTVQFSPTTFYLLVGFLKLKDKAEVIEINHVRHLAIGIWNEISSFQEGFDLLHEN